MFSKVHMFLSVSLMLYLVKGIVVENEPNNYIAHKKLIQFGGDVCFGILTRKKIGPRENPPLMHFDAIRLGKNIVNIFNFYLGRPIYTTLGILT